jgi:hypothetical protein
MEFKSMCYHCENYLYLSPEENEDNHDISYNYCKETTEEYYNPTQYPKCKFFKEKK